MRELPRGGDPVARRARALTVLFGDDVTRVACCGGVGVRELPCERGFVTGGARGSLASRGGTDACGDGMGSGVAVVATRAAGLGQVVTARARHDRMSGEACDARVARGHP